MSLESGNKTEVSESGPSYQEVIDGLFTLEREEEKSASRFERTSESDPIDYGASRERMGKAKLLQELLKQDPNLFNNSAVIRQVVEFLENT